MESRSLHYAANYNLLMKIRQKVIKAHLKDWLQLKIIQVIKYTTAMRVDLNGKLYQEKLWHVIMKEVKRF